MNAARFVAAALALLGLCSCGDAPSEPRTIVVVTIDTLRADRVGSYGHAAAHTPALDALASVGVAFDRAYAPTPITLPSHASMLTGVPAAAHGARDNGLYALTPDALFVAEVLRDAGWRTGAFVGAYVLDASFGVLQGFDTWTTPSTSSLGRSATVAERRADAVVDDAIAWLHDTPADDDAFCWVHLYDPHAPYDPPPHTAEWTSDRYDGEVAYADEQVERLLEAVFEQRTGDPWVIVTSDHGEALGDHGESSHGLLLYEPTVRIPLIVAGPDPRLTPGARSDALVSLTDVAPTVLEFAGLPRDALPDCEAPSLTTSFTDPPRGRRLELETLLPYHVHRWRGLRAVVAERWKTIGPGAREVYDVVDDPAERHDLGAAPPAGAPDLGEPSPDLGWSERRDVADDDRARLEALGYLAGSAGSDPFSLDLPDPRERRDDIARRDEVLALLGAGRKLLRLEPDPTGAVHVPGESEQERKARGFTTLERAAATLRAMGGLDSGDPWVTSHVGLVELSRGEVAAAAEAFERHALLVPVEAATHFNLGECYRQLGHGLWGLDEVVKTVRLEPSFALAYEWLLAWHSQEENPDGVIWWMTRYVETFPGRDDLAQRLASLHASGNRRDPPAPAEVERVDRLRASDEDGWLVPERLREER